MEDYDFESFAFLKNNESQGEAPSDVYLEVNALLRKVCDKFIDYGIIMMHGVAIALDGESYIFTAKSGTGKTTHIMKWLEHRPDTVVVNGDKPFIITNANNSKPMVCGSPWAGKEEMCSNVIVSLKAIVIMERSEENVIKEISFGEAFPILLQQIYYPEEEIRIRKTISCIRSLQPSVSFYLFKFNNYKADAFQVAFNALHGEDLASDLCIG